MGRYVYDWESGDCTTRWRKTIIVSQTYHHSETSIALSSRKRRKTLEYSSSRYDVFVTLTPECRLKTALNVNMTKI